MKRFRFIFFLALLLPLLGGLIFLPNVSFAQQDQLDQVNAFAGLGSEDIRIVIASIINVILSFIGIITVIIIIYGGFVWMTAGGNPEKVERAKKILISGVIGLTIILTSWIITSFVLTSLIEATGVGGSGTSEDDSDDGNLGGSDSATFAVAGVTPQGVIPIRNAVVQATFSRNVDATTVDDGSFHVNEVATGTAVAGTLSVTGNKITFTPDAACPSPNEDRHCFNENTEYRISIGVDIESTNGLLLSQCAPTCTYTFTSGTIVDVANPTATITVPDNNDLFPSGELVGVDVQATDDFQVGTGIFEVDDTQFDSLVATGADLTNVTISTSWDTTTPVATVVGEFYTLRATVTDLAGNTDSDTVSVKASPAYCFNGEIDDSEVPPEEGLDCGGLCGACDGGACTDDSQCAGTCVNGVCASIPTITQISPRDGAPGTFVTITGTSFGFVDGTISFVDSAGGLVEAVIPACSEGWTSTEVVVQVPATAVDGPITIETSSGLVDVSNDANGPSIENFDVNNVSRPNLCKLSPNAGGVGATVSVIGNTFGPTQETVTFTSGTESEDVRTYNSWADANIEIIVPALDEKKYDVTVNVDGVSSNAVAFTVVEPVSDAPLISAINPTDGGVGRYITISGDHFGSTPGLVWFESRNDGVSTLADTNFPDACASNYWSDNEVTVKVPSVATGGYVIYVERADDSAQSNRSGFNVISAAAGPGICAVTPSEGAFGDTVTIVGERFGATTGTAAFYNEANAVITSWGDEEVVTTVPNSAQSGSLTVTSASGAESNSVNFDITSVSVQGTLDAAYAWNFSTGEIPITPHVVIACNDADVSGVPNELFTQEVCINALGFAHFDTLMNEATLNENNIFVTRCENPDCSVTTVLHPDVVSSSSAQRTAFMLVPQEEDRRLRPNTEYSITVKAAVESTSGIPMESDVSWNFRTGASTSDCDIDAVRVEPPSEFLTAEGQTTEFNALPMSGQCIVLNAEDYAWSWGIDRSIASLDEGCIEQSGDSCVTVEALLEGETPVVATSTDSGVFGNSDLTINFTDPYVDNFWPNCATACVNADVGASFNIPMNESLMERPGSVVLYECENELCVNLTRVDNRATCIDEGAGCTEITMGLTANLQMHTWYRVIVSGAVTSLSDVPLTRLNYGDDFSWTFLTREDSTECSVSSIELNPQMSTLSTVGERQPYTAVPFGEADSCSVAGQRLNGFDYGWNWTDPIDDTSGDDKNIASWVEANGSLFDTNPSAVPAGCTSSCISEGSEPIVAICGDRAVDTGEDCDDGNTLSGDGCSANCLREGTDACSRTCSTSGTACLSNSDCDTAAGETCDAAGVGCCGDGTVNLREECDDGDIRSGDGCSASCLNEGSHSADLTCNDGIVSHDPAIGGEECEDGNTSNGDGCSSVCLHEGSVGISDVPAICGNGVREAPYETCDDRNLNDGDGCSARCLREGAAASLSTGFTCGNGVVDRVAGSSAGEDCDGVEGCSDQCLFLGSSLEYSTPSICGNGVFETGEFIACENGITGDGDVDPVQLAQIDDDAAAEVDDSGEATQVIEVSLDDLTANANLTLLCSAETDADCPAGFGVDSHGCCSARPSLSLFPNSADACLNSAVYVISDTEMDVNSFTGNAFIRYDGAGACPAGHETFTSTASSGRSWIARTWNSIRSIFIGLADAQESGDCIAPVQSFSQTEISPGKFKVGFTTNVLLAALSDYTIVLESGADGVLTKTGVSLPLDVEQSFTTGSEICTLDAVDIEDLTGEVEGLFTRFDDDHDMVAVPYTLKTGVQEEIQEVPGVYEWNWLAWQEDSGGTLFSVSVPDSGQPQRANVAPAGENGEATLISQAQIVDAGVTGDTVTGTLNLIAMLCENPWPSANLFPFEDTQDGFDRGIPGLNPSPAWMNFSTYYCRDTSDEASQLSELAVVSSSNPGTEAVIKEYFLAVGDSSNAIGIRIASNPEYLSPLAWYRDQGFSGNPSARTVDGFEAITDGRTTYVSAPNENEIAGQLFSNIYVLSYNEGASDETISIYNQLLDNWNFVVNINSTNLCQAGSTYTGTVCSSDLDCNTGAGEVCASQKDKLQRDTKRLADMTTIASTLDIYGSVSRLCSSTSTQSCTTALDCPAGEACLPSYPTLPSGTFIRSITSSVWSSWNDTFASLVGGLPSDPLNRYAECGPDSAYPDYDAATCVNQTLGQYICPEKSYTYHYRSAGPFGYEVTSDLEYQSQAPSVWYNPIDTSVTNALDITVGKATVGSGAGFVTSSAFCDGTVYGNSNTCGDGVVGLSEVCELGQGGTGVACDSDGNGSNDGYRPTICNASCTAFEASPATSCVPYACGNGVLEAGEICDDGSLNGDYGYCNNDCSGHDFFCGDGSIAGGEVCDCGTSIIGGLTVGGGACSALNGVYRSNPNNSCAWDCGGSASYCGDGIVNTGESCDGDVDTWSAQLCRNGANKGMPCTSDAECAGSFCGQGATAKTWAAECPVSTVCLGGVNDGLACASAADCSGGTCSAFTVQTERTRTCADDGTAGQLCGWEQATWQNIACKAPGSCGDGIVDQGEQCDDGNTDETDNCTNVCTANVCGDGYLYQGVEQCDEGSDNGIVCSSAYESTCTYCSSSCRVLTSSGSFCGDGVINGTEFCDAGDLLHYWYNASNRHTNGTCEPGSGTSGNFTCTNIGVCNGGADNGLNCSGNNQCAGAGVCVKPTCEASCTASCPFTYASVPLQMLDNQVGAVRSSSVNLLSTTETEDVTNLGDPNAATIFVTSCSALDSLVMDLDDANRQYPDVDIMFVLDVSQTMDDEIEPGLTRLEVLQSAVSDAATTLFEEYAGVSGGTMRIGLAYVGNTHGTDTNGDGEYQSSELYNFAGTDSRAPGGFAGMAPSSNEATVAAAISTLLSDVAPDAGTPLYESLKDARDAFDGTADVEYVVVFTDGVINFIDTDYAMLTHDLINGTDTDSDGEVDSDEYMRAVTGLTNNMKNSRDMKIFTAVLSPTSCNRRQMEKWSNLDCTAQSFGCTDESAEGNYSCGLGDDGVDYSYTATTADELNAMYDSIVDAILNITVSLTYNGETAATTVDAQSAVPVTLPNNFSCDGSDEQDVFLKLSFNDSGEGTVGVSNVRANMCAE